jgi:hypothetical protein
MFRMPLYELFTRAHHGGDAALHIGCTTAIKNIVSYCRREGVILPLLDRAGRNNVSMPCEHKYGFTAAAPRPQIVDLTETVVFDGKAKPLQAIGNDSLAALVVRRDRWPGDQLFSEFKRCSHL